jgi:hypothetical protein
MRVVEIATIASRPDLAPMIHKFPQSWPTFMYHDETGSIYHDDAATAYPEFVMLAVDAGQPVARLFSVPFAWDGDPSRRCRTAGGTGRSVPHTAPDPPAPRRT